MASKHSVTFSITLPIPIYEKLNKRADKLKMKRSAYVRHLIINHVNEKLNTITKQSNEK